MEADDNLWPPFGPGTSLGRGRPESRPRGRNRQRPTLTRDEIVAAAIGEADRVGADAVSMRKIAQVLQAGAMSLYWHVASKEHLLELMLDSIVAEIEVPEPTGDWRGDLRTHARRTRAVLLRHRWVLDFFGARPPLGPNTLRNLDKTLALLDGLDVGLPTAISILQTLDTYVSGAVIREFQEIRTQREQEQMEVSKAEFVAKLDEWKSRLAETGMFSHFLRMLDANLDPDAEQTRDERFEFGLDCVLDGIAAKIAACSGAAAPPSERQPAESSARAR